MRISPLSFIALVEEKLRPNLSDSLLGQTAKWRFQRIINFHLGSACLQVWIDHLQSDDSQMQGSLEIKQGKDQDQSYFLKGQFETSASSQATPISLYPGSQSQAEEQAAHLVERWTPGLLPVNELENRAAIHSGSEIGVQEAVIEELEPATSEVQSVAPEPSAEQALKQEAEPVDADQAPTKAKKVAKKKKGEA